MDSTGLIVDIRVEIPETDDDGGWILPYNSGKWGEKMKKELEFCGGGAMLADTLGLGTGEAIIYFTHGNHYDVHNARESEEGLGFLVSKETLDLMIAALEIISKHLRE